MRKSGTGLMRKRSKVPMLPVALVVGMLLCWSPAEEAQTAEVDIPPYSGEAYVVLRDNQPEFDPADYTLTEFESYSVLDDLGRCGVAYANVCVETMPTEERGEIGQIRPSGWHTVRYDFVDGQYLYNRCHLIGFQLTGENANEQNLITGTRYMNTVGMLPFENQVADYVRETEHHVLYRVTPVYDGTSLVASGVQIEAFSIEDGGEGVCFNVFVYNVQPGVVIDYATGENEVDEAYFAALSGGGEMTYVLNLRSRRFHYPDCVGVSTMSEHNRQDYTGTREQLIAQGYKPCGTCKP